ARASPPPPRRRTATSSAGATRAGRPGAPPSRRGRARSRCRSDSRRRGASPSRTGASAATLRRASSRPSGTPRCDPTSMDLDSVSEVLQDEPSYRVRQVWEWAARGASSYGEMTNLPARSRALLEERVPFSTLTLVHQATSVDGTVKALFHTHEGHP